VCVVKGVDIDSDSSIRLCDVIETWSLQNECKDNEMFLFCFIFIMDEFSAVIR
jgi:hypothetical protein